MYDEDLKNIMNTMIRVRNRAPYHKSYGRTYESKRNVEESTLVSAVEALGLKVSVPYHAHGIGNNNRYTIKKRISLQDGYEAEAIIGYLEYNYDLYAKHVFVSFMDKDDVLVYEYPNNSTYHMNE